MTKITQGLILFISLMLLLACDEPDNTNSSSDTAPAVEHKNPQAPVSEQPAKTKSPELNLSLPDETIADQKTVIPDDQPHMPELFDQKKASSKYQVDGQVLLDEEQKSGAEVRITIKQ